MIEQRAQIVASDATYATVRVFKRSACERCARGEGCGGGIFAKLAGDREFEFQLASDPRFHVEDIVVIGLPETIVLRVSLLFYGWPLMLLITTAIAAQTFMPSSVWVVLMAIGGGSVGMFSIGVLQKRLLRDCQPRILRKLSPLECGALAPT